LNRAEKLGIGGPLPAHVDVLALGRALFPSKAAKRQFEQTWQGVQVEGNGHHFVPERCRW